MTALYSNPLAGDIPSPAQLKTWLPIVARRTGDSAPVNNSIALVNDSQLFASLTNDAVYEFTAGIRYSTNATANFQCAWAGPAGYAMNYDLLGAQGSTFGLYSETETNIPQVAVSNGIVRMSGLIYTGAAAGNLQFRWAQATANVSNTLVLFGSYIKLTQIQ